MLAPGFNCGIYQFGINKGAANVTIENNFGCIDFVNRCVCACALCGIQFYQPFFVWVNDGKTKDKFKFSRKTLNITRNNRFEYRNKSI